MNDLGGDGGFVERQIGSDCFGLYSQVIKRTRWMPWQPEAMKDVVACDKLRGVGKQTLLPGDFRMGKPSALARYLHLNI